MAKRIPIPSRIFMAQNTDTTNVLEMIRRLQPFIDVEDVIAQKTHCDSQSFYSESLDQALIMRGKVGITISSVNDSELASYFYLDFPSIGYFINEVSDLKNFLIEIINIFSKESGAVFATMVHPKNNDIFDVDGSNILDKISHDSSVFLNTHNPDRNKYSYIKITAPAFFSSASIKNEKGSGSVFTSALEKELVKDLKNVITFQRQADVNGFQIKPLTYEAKYISDCDTIDRLKTFSQYGEYPDPLLKAGKSKQ